MILRKANQNLNEQEYIDNIPQGRNDLIQYLLENQNGNISSFPIDTPLEVNPYTNIKPLENFDKYIIGTFPPISYILDENAIIGAGITVIDNQRRPKIPYFHGNSKKMWRLFFPPNFINFDANNNHIRYERRAEILNFLENSEVNYSDVIYSTKRNEYTSNDTDLGNVVINKELIKHILNNPNVNHLLFNTSSTFSQDGISIHINNVVNGTVGRINVNGNQCNSFCLFFRACQDFGFKVEFKVKNTQGEILLDWTEVNAANTNSLRNELITLLSH